MNDNIIVSRNAIGQMLGDLVDGYRMSAIAALRTILESAEKAEPVAWEVGGRLCLRIDVRDALTGPLGWRGDYVDMGRAIPDSWVPKLYAAPVAAERKE